MASSGLLRRSPETKSHLDASVVGRHKEYYMGKVVASLEFERW